MDCFAFLLVYIVICVWGREWLSGLEAWAAVLKVVGFSSFYFLRRTMLHKSCKITVYVA